MNSKPATEDEQAAFAVADKDSHAGVRLLEVAEANAEFFHDPDRVAYAAISVNGHREVWPLTSRGFEDWLRGAYYRQGRKGAGRQAYETALATLRAKALYDGPQRPVMARTACSGNAYYIDLCDQEWRVVTVDATGWRIVDKSAET
jgi:hypothetical protein